MTTSTNLAQISMIDRAKKITGSFNKLDSEKEPVREWLLGLKRDDRQVIGKEIQKGIGLKFVKSLTVASILLAFGSFGSLSAEGVNFNLEYRESDIGIDYRAIAEPPLDVLLSHGEAEFLENATPVFGDETAEAWRATAAEIGTGNVAEYTIEGMKEFTPNMLTRFGLLDFQNPKFERLFMAGSRYISEGELANTQN